MAAPSAGAAAAGSPRGGVPVTPRHIRDLIGRGIAAGGTGNGGKDISDPSESANGSSQMEENSLESASREAYFSRVETFTISFGMLPLGNPGISSFPQGSNPALGPSQPKIPGSVPKYSWSSLGS
ncbi:nuclear-interacting partner of ALK-like [Neopelma chrysocephalum]|uniref:nuclear-interacting partner of ALK-like n=1 Tax=Neopelma chrysocephalum TaxID=114329 RepID=UPI000FCD0DBA|nr:nuclear-interacting partner of ALK-like [Neopelma chrysocephalum]